MSDNKYTKIMTQSSRAIKVEIKRCDSLNVVTTSEPITAVQGRADLQFPITLINQSHYPKSECDYLNGG